MHIGYWCPAWPMEKFQNGIITYVHWMKRELERRGHRVSIFTQGEPPTVTDPQVHYVKAGLRHRIRRRLSSILQPVEFNLFDHSAVIASGILESHRRDPIDVFEMEETFGWFATIARRTAIPFVVKLHGPAFLTLPVDERNSPFGREKIKREGIALRTVSAVVAPSKWALTKTMEFYKLTPREAAQVANPIGVEPNAPLWGKDTCDRSTILYVGRFDMIKGADVMLRAFSVLLESRPDTRLIFVGPDHGIPEPDGRLLKFEDHCKLHYPLSFRARVDFRGQLAIGEVARLRTRAMVTVAASRSENQPYAVLEAMLQGCPVVTTDAGGCPEIVSDGVTGLLAKSENPDDFARRIATAMENIDASAAIGHAARRHVIENFSPAKVADASLEMYEKVIAMRQ